METNKNYYLVRGVNSGVFFGEIAKRKGEEVIMTNARNIWRWEGANSLMDIANGAAIDNDYTHITPACMQLELTDICELIPIPEEVYNKLNKIKSWTTL